MYQIRRTVTNATANTGYFANGINNNLDNSVFLGYQQAIKIIGTEDFGYVDFTQPFSRGLD